MNTRPSAAVRLKRLLVGRPLATERMEHERLSKKLALAILSSDAISSVAYATEQILVVLAVLGTVAVTLVLPVSAAIVGLMVLVGLSYRQTIFAYPSGGGSYTVAKENLGMGAGLVAAAALLTDYILTVAVSISSGIQAITSAYPVLEPRTVTLCILAIFILMVINLRGVRESGAVFSVPTYVFTGMMLLMIGLGIYKVWLGHEPVPTAGPTRVDPLSAAQHAGMIPAGFAFMYLMLRGFAEGCVAMTGTEAISNGIQSFKRPAPKNAAATLGLMVGILAVLFLGVGFLAQHFQVLPTQKETILSQINRQVFSTGVAYYILQFSTFAILVLAANTAFAGFPVLAGILANERFMPRQLAARGDRLAFSNGIIVLSLVAMLLVWAFRGNTSALVPLYAVGVFVCFTLSQWGMVRHWLTTHEPGWQWRAALNGVGALATGLVAIIQVTTKFIYGAWIVVLLIPLLIMMLRGIRRHYDRFALEIAFDGTSPINPLHHVVVVPVGGVTKAVAAALVYATAISDDVRAVYVEVDPESTARMREAWEKWDTGIPLVVIPSPYRSVLRPLVEYVETLESGPGDLATVVIPEIVPRRWWEHLLHNKTALYIKAAFLLKPAVVVTSVPFHLGHAYRIRDLIDYDADVGVKKDMTR